MLDAGINKLTFILFYLFDSSNFTKLLYFLKKSFIFLVINNFSFKSSHSIINFFVLILYDLFGTILNLDRIGIPKTPSVPIKILFKFGVAPYWLF